jgi:hypothetical protein
MNLLMQVGRNALNELDAGQENSNSIVLFVQVFDGAHRTGNRFVRRRRAAHDVYKTAPEGVLDEIKD